VEEGEKIAEALRYMEGFPSRYCGYLKEDCPFHFRTNPQVTILPQEPVMKVCAVVEVFGMVFTQGKVSRQSLSYDTWLHDII
jgi:hypothetical protein